MKNLQMIALLMASLVATGSADLGYGRKLLQTQTQYQGVPATITVSAANPNVNAITITLSIPYPQNPYYCNVTGDSRIPQQGVFPLTVRVPVGVTSTVIFANITGPIPGTSCTGSSVVQQQSPSSVVQQSSPSSVVQQSSPSSVVQQQSSPSSVVQQQSSPSSVVQQPGGTSVQQMVNSVVQQNPGGAVVQQKYATSINQQNPGATSYMNNCVSNATSVVQQQGTPSSVVQQQGTPSSVVQQQSPSTVVQQQSPSTVVQQQSPSTVVQQQTPSSVVQQTGRHLLQVGTIEYISNNGSTGQPQLTVLDTVEGVPNISFKPTAAGQTASFSGGLQVAVTTTNDGFGTPYIPYRVDSKLSPQCGVKVNFVAI